MAGELQASDYTMIPIRRGYFDELFDYGIHSEQMEYDDFELLPIKNHEQDSFFPRISANPIRKRDDFLVLVNSNEIITGESFSSNRVDNDDRGTTYLSKMMNLQSTGVSGAILNQKSAYYPKDGSTIITYGPWLTFPHKDELLMGATTLLPSWNPSNCIKLWIFSIDTARKTNRMIEWRSSSRFEDPQIQHDRVALMLLDSVKRNYAVVIIQRPGQVLTFKSGHVHAVITAFAPSECPAVCIMETKNKLDNIAVANRALPKNHIVSYSSAYEEKRVEETFDKAFKRQKHSFKTSKVQQTANKRELTKNNNKKQQLRKLILMNQSKYATK